MWEKFHPFLIKVLNTRTAHGSSFRGGHFNNVAAATGMKWTGTFRFTLQNMWSSISHYSKCIAPKWNVSTQTVKLKHHQHNGDKTPPWALADAPQLHIFHRMNNKIKRIWVCRQLFSPLATSFGVLTTGNRAQSIHSDPIKGSSLNCMFLSSMYCSYAATGRAPGVTCSRGKKKCVQTRWR